MFYQIFGMKSYDCTITVSFTMWLYASVTTLNITNLQQKQEK